MAVEPVELFRCLGAATETHQHISAHQMHVRKIVIQQVQFSECPDKLALSK